MREIDVQNAIRVALSPYGIVLRLNNGLFYTKDGRAIRSGLPPGTSDLLFVGRNYVAFIEVKQQYGRAQEQQLRFLDAMRGLGHKAGIARSVEDALNIIQEAKP